MRPLLDACPAEPHRAYTGPAQGDARLRVTAASRKAPEYSSRSVAAWARHILPAALVLASIGLAQAAEVLATIPEGVDRQVPPGYVVLGSAAASFGAHAFHILALGKQGEDTLPRPPAPAAARPLLLFERRPDGSFRPAGRNDTVVMRADEGGQCDPFLDGGGTIAVTGRYFTVQNGVACGQHWTDYITFRFDDGLGHYVFDNERSESWRLNPDQRPDAEAVVRDTPAKVVRADKAHPLPFGRWRPRWSRGG